MPSLSQYSISEDTLPQLRWAGRRGWARASRPTAPKPSSLAELGPFCVLLPPLRPYPRPPQTPCFLLRFVGVRRETLKSGTFCGLSVTSKKRQWAEQFPSERRKRDTSQQTRETVRQWAWSPLASSLTGLLCPLVPTGLCRHYAPPTA